MANKEVERLFASFEDLCFKHDGADAWRARDLMPRLGYANWQNFREAIKRAWESCVAAGTEADSNFVIGDGSQPWRPQVVLTEASKNPQGGAPREDVILTRRAAYLVTMNGDPRKPEVAFAQHYFATATRTLEVIEQRIAETGRLTARERLTETENRFQGVLYQQDVTGPGIARIRSKGDTALFGGKDTDDMKKKWKVPKNRPLADFAPEVAIVAKQLGAAMTTHNVRRHDLRGEDEISAEHVQNNERVRGTLKDRGIVLETLDGEEDLKKVERRHSSEAKKLNAPSKQEKPKAKKGKGAK
jgi:DNA-damage-inducible protein D